MNGLPDARCRMRQVRMFADRYGLAVDERHRLAYRIIEFAAQSTANEVIEQQITPEPIMPLASGASRGRHAASPG
jgi:hypothetical protein